MLVKEKQNKKRNTDKYSYRCYEVWGNFPWPEWFYKQKQKFISERIEFFQKMPQVINKCFHYDMLTNFFALVNSYLNMIN